MPVAANRADLVLTGSLVALIVAQSIWGRSADALYLDEPRIAWTWIGNDWFNLLVAAPLLSVAAIMAARGSVRARLVWIGVLAAMVYNYAFYLIGAQINAAFPLYVALVLTAAVALARVLLATRPGPEHAGVARGIGAKIAAAYLIGVAVVLSMVWTVLWHGILSGTAQGGLGPDAFQVVAALDMLFLVPVLVLGGVLLWTRQPWAGIIGPAAAIHGACYLGILATNAVNGVVLGHAVPPGETVVWGPLFAATLLCAAFLLRRVAPT